MQDILTCAMGLDVRRDIIVACLAKGELGTCPEIEIRSFSTLVPEMKKLRDWGLEAGCHHIAMESTGIYWQPIYEMLEPCFEGKINILVVNARHMKNVPGRKTDMRDAQWIATLLRAGLLKGSFMSSFSDSQHSCSWAGLSPGNNESAGKRKSAHINKGNPYLKSMLCEISWVISGKRTLYLSGWYWRIKQRKGSKRATIALARKLLTLIYSILKTGQPYDEDCFEQRRKRCERKRAHRMVNELQRLGYTVVPPN